MDEEKQWKKVLELIKAQIDHNNFKTWFGQTQLSSIDNQSIKLFVPSAFHKGEIPKRYESLILGYAQQILGHPVKLQLTIDSSKFAKTDQAEEPAELELNQAISASPLSSPLNPKYTLENFVVGLTNNLAYAAAQAVVANPGISYNPLFIYGPSGVGKTHLMQAIGNALLRQNPQFKLVFAPSERFMNDFVDSIQNKTNAKFRAKYRNCHVFLIDDIQFISGKESTQEEFFHTFNELQARNTQVILTSDRPPNEIQKLEPRLQSRFQGGLMVDIQMPDFETRVAILRAKLAQSGDTLPEDCLNLIAETVRSNTRELEGKLIQIVQTLKLKNLTAEIGEVKKILGTETQSTNPLDHKRVLNQINLYFNIKMPDLLGPRRQKELVLPRQIAMFVLYEDCHLPHEKIGQILGGRDHTTILHGVDKIRLGLTRDTELQRLLSEVRGQLSK